MRNRVSYCADLPSRMHSSITSTRLFSSCVVREQWAADRASGGALVGWLCAGGMGGAWSGHRGVATPAHPKKAGYSGVCGQLGDWWAWARTHLNLQPPRVRPFSKQPSTSTFHSSGILLSSYSSSSSTILQSFCNRSAIWLLLSPSGKGSAVGLRRHNNYSVTTASLLLSAVAALRSPA